jgi:hypothetical protein
MMLPEAGAGSPGTPAGATGWQTKPLGIGERRLGYGILGVLVQHRARGGGVIRSPHFSAGRRCERRRHTALFLAEL